MGDTDHNRDEQLREMLEQFFRRLVNVHGLSHEEAWIITTRELQSAYDDRKKLRRSSFTLIEGQKQD